MLFNTLTFALFLPLVFGLFQLLPGRGRQAMLLAASYVFYAWEHPAYLALLLASTVLDFSCGLLMDRRESPRWRRGVLMVSLCGNLGLLGFFKYGDFVASNVMGIGRLLGFDHSWAPMGFLLPVGISFYTFQTMSYAIERYRRRIEPCRDPLVFALFVAFFPQLVAGPIERAGRLLPQLTAWRKVDWEDIAAGLQRIIFGLFRKLVVADRFAIMVDRCYTHHEELGATTLWVGAFAFSMQIYFDFAGYADIAIGSARLFGVRLTENFRRPIVSRNIADFWNRWHITLTSWLRDYVFAPLGGARSGGARSALNGVIVLLLCGLWHGADWTFVCWGLFHAVHMVLFFAWRFSRRRRGLKTGPRGASLSTALTIIAVMTVNTISGVFFRAPSLPEAGRVLRAMAGFGPGRGATLEWYTVAFALMVFLCIAIEYAQEYAGLNERMARLPWWIKALGMCGVVMLTILGATNLTNPYIYFQF